MQRRERDELLELRDDLVGHERRRAEGSVRRARSGARRRRAPSPGARRGARRGRAVPSSSTACSFRPVEPALTTSATTYLRAGARAGGRTRTRASTATIRSAAREHRVQVELGDLREILRQLRDAQQQVGERRLVERRAAEAGDEPPEASARQHPLGVRVAERGEREVGVGDQLRQHAARARRRRSGRSARPARRRRGAPRPRRATCGWTRTGAADAVERVAHAPPPSRARATTPPLSLLCAPATAVLRTTGKPSSLRCRPPPRRRSRTAPARRRERRTRARSACVSTGSSQRSPSSSAGGDDRRAASRSIPSGTVIAPGGSASHSARAAARASARAAEPGKSKTRDGAAQLLRAEPSSKRTPSTGFVDRARLERRAQLRRDLAARRAHRRREEDDHGVDVRDRRAAARSPAP